MSSKEEKSSKFYYTIGEVSNLLEIKPHVLRYWEKEFTQLNPQKKFGRIRRYDQKDIETIKKIKYLLYTQRYTIEGVKKKLKEIQRQKEQLELDFYDSKDEIKQKIIKKLKHIKHILDTE